MNDAPSSLTGPPLTENETEFDRIVCEISLQLERGEPLDLDQLKREHPDYYERIVPLLPTFRAMADLGHWVSSETSPATKEAHPSLPQGVLGDFRIVREIGRGGMAVVYEAEQISLQRTVALKVLPFASVLDQRQLQRFKNEALAAASLDHHGIVNVLAVGCERSVHFYAMRYVDGKSFAMLIEELRRQYLETERSGKHSTASAELQDCALRAGHSESTRRRADLTIPGSDRGPQSAIYVRRVAEIGAEVADAMHHAHENGVVHRDIKPSNLLLDADGHAWITDFGLARISTEPGLTMTGDILGTLRYMSPEQALGNRAATDHRTDIYSLGVTLYELLTLQPAFVGEDRRSIVNRIAVSEPPAPHRLNSAIPRQLETIILTCVDKEPARRYATAADLAADLRRFAVGQPILARRISRRERFRLWCRRNPVIAGLATMAVVLLMTLAVGSAIAAVRFRQLAGRESKLRQEADAAHKMAIDRNQRLTRAIASEQAAARRLQVISYAQRIGLAYHEWQSNSTTRAKRLLEDCPSAMRRWEWNYVQRLCHSARRDIYVPSARFVQNGLEGARRQFTAIDYSPDGQRIVVGSSGSPGVGGQVEVRDVRTGRLVFALGVHVYDVRQVVFSSDGEWIASISGFLARDTHERGSDNVKIWNATTGELAHSPGPGLLALDAAHTKPLFAWQTPENHLQAFDMANQEIVWSLDVPAVVHDIAFSPDDAFLAAACQDHVIRVWDLSNGTMTATLAGHDQPVRRVAFDPSGELIVSCGRDDHAKVWGWKQDACLFTLHSPEGRFDDAEFHPDGETVATTSSRARSIGLWRSRDGAPVTHLRSDDGALAMAFASDGSTLAVANSDSTVCFRDLKAESSPQTLGRHDFFVNVVGFSPDGQLIASGGNDAAVNVFDLATQQTVFSFRQHREPVKNLQFTSSGEAIVSVGLDGQLIVWQPRTGRVIWKREGLGKLRGLAVAPNGRLLAIGDGTGHVTLIDGETHEIIRRFPAHREAIWSLDFNADGTKLASGGEDRMVHVWNIPSGDLLHALSGHNAIVRSVVFSPDDARIFSASQDDRLVQVWDADEGRLLHSLTHSQPVFGLAISPDGRRLVVAASGGLLKLWDAVGFQELLALKGSSTSYHSAAFSPNGHFLVAGGFDQRVYLWNGTPIEPIGIDRSLAWNAVRDVLNITWAKDELLEQLRVNPELSESVRRIALEIADEYQETAEMLNWFAWVKSSKPGGGMDNYERAVRHAERAVALDPQNSLMLNSLGMAYFRTRRWEEAKHAIEDAIANHSAGGTAFDWYILAMIHHQQGFTRESRAAFDRGRAWTESHPELSATWVEELSGLRDEAAEYLQAVEPDVEVPPIE
ncbi:MAG: protein kinase [Planctomycetales bacterium]|nr:protein kinase [Planctomycetales bacterium]